MYLNIKIVNHDTTRSVSVISIRYHSYGACFKVMMIKYAKRTFKWQENAAKGGNNRNWNLSCLCENCRSYRFESLIREDAPQRHRTKSSNSNKHLVMRTRRGSTSGHTDWLTICPITWFRLWLWLWLWSCSISVKYKRLKLTRTASVV
jgi:hypothetical protein